VKKSWRLPREQEEKLLQSGEQRTVLSHDPRSMKGAENMMMSEATLVIHTSPGEVFRFVAHGGNFPQWVRGAHMVNVSEGSFGDGTLIQQGQVVVRVSHVQVNQGFETESIRIHFPTRFVLKHTHGMVQFEPVEQGTQVTLKEQLVLPPFLKPVEQLIAKKAHQESQATLEQLKTLLEQKKEEAPNKREL
jgi:hypothetical protein